jgi:dihydrofolate reductase
VELGLIDEFRLFVTPMILGSGKPLFRPMEDRVALTRVGEEPRLGHHSLELCAGAERRISRVIAEQ